MNSILKFLDNPTEKEIKILFPAKYKNKAETDFKEKFNKLNANRNRIKGEIIIIPYVRIPHNTRAVNKTREIKTLYRLLNIKPHEVIKGKYCVHIDTDVRKWLQNYKLSRHREKNY